MVIPVAVSYDLESIATLESLPECPYFHLKHVDFKLIGKIFLCDIHNYPIHLFLFRLSHLYSAYSVITLYKY